LKKENVFNQIDPDHIFNATNNGLIIIDNNRTILSSNEKVFEILGMKKQEIRGKSISLFFPEIDKMVSRILKNKDDILGEQITEQGISIILNISTIKEKDSFLGIVVSFQQTILFEQAAKKLEFYKLQNKELNAIFQSVYDALWVCDGQGYVININRASEKLNKIRKQDVIGKKVDELIQKGMFDKSVTTQVLKKKKQVTIVQYIKKTKRKILATGTPVFNESGEISLVVVNSRDLTSLNIIKEKLEKSLEESDRLRDALQEMNLQEISKQDVIGESKAIQSVLKIALKLSHMEISNILLLGESGTGKGLMAKFIHKNSKRKNKIFMQINCAALPDNLLEAELFGYEKGAFTGARSHGKPGLIELAENGTLFLDEIGELPLVLQSKLLKYFDDQMVMRIGGIKPRKIDCIIITATNRNLESRVKQKLFRQDLFYRINTFTITIPPLRERPEDIFDIVTHYLNKYNKQFQAHKKISLEAFSMIQKYNFPGNVRELKNIIKKGVVLSDSKYLDEHLLKDFRLTTEIINPFNPDEVNVFNFKNAMMAYEKDILLHMLKICRTTRQIAKKMGIDHSTVVRKLKKHSLSTSGA
jgi:PAS domain S-box-containing protein